MCLDMDKSLSILHISSHMLQLSVLIGSITFKNKMYTLAAFKLSLSCERMAQYFCKDSIRKRVRKYEVGYTTTALR